MNGQNRPLIKPKRRLVREIWNYNDDDDADGDGDEDDDNEDDADGEGDEDDDNEDDADGEGDSEGWEIYRMLHISADNASDLDHFLVASNLSNLITCPATLDHIQLTLAF